MNLVIPILGVVGFFAGVAVASVGVIVLVAHFGFGLPLP